MDTNNKFTTVKTKVYPVRTQEKYVYGKALQDAVIDIQALPSEPLKNKVYKDLSKQYLAFNNYSLYEKS